MLINSVWITAEWPRLLEDAGIAMERVQLIIVREQQRSGTAECAYCSPSMNPPLPPRTNAVIRRIDADRLAQHHHIVCAWQGLPAADEISTSALIRHELEHARHWERYGPQLIDELDAELKTVAEVTGRSYHCTPVEQAADDAARAWIESRYDAAEAARLAEVFPHWPHAPLGARRSRGESARGDRGDASCLGARRLHRRDADQPGDAAEGVHRGKQWRVDGIAS